MSRKFLRLCGVFALSSVFATGCVSLAPSAGQSLGRGAAPLEKGTLRAFGSGGAGVGIGAALAGGGVGIEAQVLGPLAVGATVAGSAQLGLAGGDTFAVIPGFSAIGHGQVHVQYNPLVDWVAFRARAALGAEANSRSTRPFASMSIGPVFSLPEDLIKDLDLWTEIGLDYRAYGLRKVGFSNEPDRVAAVHAELGAGYELFDALTLFGAATATAGLINLGLPFLGGGLQLGVAYTF